MDKGFKRRVLATGIFTMGIACFFIYRLTDLHFSSKIQISLKKQYDHRRGYIKDINGNILALSIEKNSLFANPEEINNPDEFARKLSPVAGIPERFILDRIKRNKRFVWIKRKLDDPYVESIKGLNLKGLYFIKEYQRTYPNNRLASHILGFVDTENTGLDGIEYKYNNILLSEEKSGIFARNEEKKSVSNITLTIDKYIQYISEKEIKKAVLDYKAIEGVALTIEVKTGKILAYAKYPDFDPNYYYRFTDTERGSYTVTNSFEPGSTMKIMALATILEKNPKAAEREYYCPGSIVIYDKTIDCTRIHGNVNMNDIIKYSCNVGIMEAIKSISKDDYFEVLKRFGFGDKTGVEVPGESAGILRPVKEWSGLSKYSISIGYEISCTSMQLAAALSAIANGGVYIYPTIIERIEKEDGSIVDEYESRIKGRIVSAANTAKILQMMRNVVTGGTGESAGFDYYSPAGKTGTAQKPMKQGGYYTDKNLASFIGVAPLRDPDICVLVILDEPKILSSGGQAAAPVFAGIAKKVLVYRGERINKIAPEDPYTMNKTSRRFDGQTMPDFSGLMISDSIELLLKIQKKFDINYNFTGTGKVYRQTPDTGKKLTGKQQIELYLKD